ncbi:MAG: alkaline phosphatase family protein [Paludibacteraceae bacterium]|nr:alkaline phosphatase family protein [Paludibacteraceae bacterium]
MRKATTLLFLALFTSLRVYSLQLPEISDSAEFYLLTCEPGQISYEKFGHTGIRVVDGNLDATINWGEFNFNEPHFIYKFVKGETDYRVGIYPTSLFLYDYLKRGSAVFQNRINFNVSQKHDFWHRIQVNFRPENIKYRYNFIYDNCATRAYTMILLSADSSHYDFPNENTTTYRELVNEYATTDTWLSLGINLVFGADADVPIPMTGMATFPIQAMHILTNTSMVCDSARVPVLGESKILFNKENAYYLPKTDRFVEIMMFCMPILILAIFIFMYYIKKRHYWFIPTQIVLWLTFLVSLLIIFLDFFSTHPLVQRNYNLLWCNPFNAVLAVTLCFKRKAKIKGYMAFIATFMTVIYFFIIAWGKQCCTLPLLGFVIMVFGIQAFIYSTYSKVIGKIRSRRIHHRHHRLLHRHNHHSHGNIIIFALLSAATTLSAQQPRLAVVISIDGLKPYDIETYRSSIESNGFSRLTSEAAAYIPNARCNWNTASRATFYASLMTGATPNLHGIVDSHFFSMVDNGVISCIDDPRFDGINTRLEASPRMLQANTITDQLKSFFPTSRIYSIARNAESAIMMGGHLADAVVWIDDEKGEWATSKYYEKGLPIWALQQNTTNGIKTVIGKPWQPLENITTYHYAPRTKNTWDLPRPIFQESEKISEILNSPFVNDQITQLAIRALKDDQLGTDESPDMLMIEYSLHTPFSEGTRCAEYEDAIMRLDANLVSLLNALDIAVGLNNTVIILTATPQIDHTAIYSDRRLPHPQFHNERSLALLNSYLMALYGQGSWVTAYHNRQIFLNHQLIDNQSIPLHEIQNKTAEFMAEFQTVLTATPAHTLAMPTSANSFDIISRQANSHYKHRSGDVVLTLIPGANDLDNDESVTFNPLFVPLLIYAIDSKFEKSVTDMTITEVCPTLARLLWITAPNAATEMGR